MDLLPSDVIIEIFKFCKINNVLLVSKQFNLFVENLWDFYLDRDYEHKILKGSNKVKYIKCFRLTKLLANDIFKDKNIIELYNLTKLDLSYNQIKDLPKELSLLVNLQCLSLSYNEIEVLPKELSLLTNLQVLNLSNNSIEILPKELSLLVNLQHLYLYNNEIEVLPKELSSLVNLQKLYLYNNKIKEIPKELKIMKNNYILML